MKEDTWEPCPRCESNRVQVMGKLYFFLVGFSSMGCFFWLIFLIPPVGIAGVIFGLLILIASPLLPKTLHCKDCKKSWAVKNKNYEKWLQKINIYGFRSKNKRKMGLATFVYGIILTILIIIFLVSIGV